MSTHRTFLEQAAHYFTRPHEGVPAAPVASPAAWRGSEMRGRTSDWLESLSSEDLDELDAAVTGVMAAGLPMDAVTRDSFPLPGLARKIRAWRREIESGRGFVVLRGLPVRDWGRQRSALAYWGLGHQLGLPGAQNPAGELLGHVVDYGEEKENPNVRRYRTTGRIDFHCDAADVVGLLCLETARSGGQSRIASSVTIWNEIAGSHPDLAKRLFEPFLLDRRGEERPGEPGFLPIPPCRYSGGALRTFYHSDYFRSVVRHPTVGALDREAAEVLDRYDALAADPDLHLDMWLERGDVQFISNHTTIHARTAYEDHPEPERKRHLLRLWLSFD